MKQIKHEDRRNERGSVLVLTLMLTLVILGIGLMAMWMSSSATKVSGNLVRRQEAMQSARAGVQRARAILLELAGGTGYTAALKGENCIVSPGGDAARVAAFTPGKGWLLCEGKGTAAKGPTLDKIKVVDVASATHSVAVSELDNVTFTAWVRNDDDEYRWCDGVLDEGESLDNGDCNKDGNPNDAADNQKRLLEDEDSRIILRVEARGRDGLSFAAVEVLVSGRIPVSIQNLYTQSGGSGGQNSNSVILR